ncbi:MAG: DUF6800 family protein [Candidatus Peribacteraceae bacterium]|jgi:hypothetical protein
MSRIRQRELHARHVRRKKLAKLRVRYTQAKSAVQKGKIIDQVAHVAPLLTEKEFMALMKGE